MPHVTLTINAPNEPFDLLTLDLAPGMTIKDMKAIIQAEAKFPNATQKFFFNGRPLTNEAQTLEEAGIADGDMLALLICQRDGVMRSQIGREGSGSLDDAGTGRSEADLKTERERQKHIALLKEDPFNTEAQCKIEEILRQDRIIENLQDAYENNPGAFGRISMLYINTVVNGHPVKAMVATCAEATIMSPSCAESCGIVRLIDTRYSGVAQGVGTARIIGRVHHVELKIGETILPCALTIMEGNTDLLLGLDMLKRYKAKIDLKENVLCFEGVEVPFLDESEISRRPHQSRVNKPNTSTSYSTNIGARSLAMRTKSATTASTSRTTVRPPPSPPPPTLRNRPEQIPQEKIDQLVGLGFPREKVIQALRAADGDSEHAAGLLFYDMD